MYSQVNCTGLILLRSVHDVKVYTIMNDKHITLIFNVDFDLIFDDFEL